MSKARIRELNGYRVIYEPDHPSAMNGRVWGGYVYEHIMVMEEILGRRLQGDEEVHHLDLNRSNNRSENLIVLTQANHLKLHMWITLGCYLSKNEIGGINKGNEWKTEPGFCKCCLKTLQAKQKRYCSEECRNKGTRVVKRPSAIDLADDIDSMSWLAIGRKYGVSDNAVRKWARAYGLI